MSRSILHRHGDAVHLALLHRIFTADKLGSHFWDHLFRKSPAAELDEEDAVCELMQWNSSQCSCMRYSFFCNNAGLSQPPAGLPSHGIELLDLSGGSFPILNAQIMAALPDVESLVLSHSGVETLAAEAFLTAPGLQTLILARNQLSTLPRGAFRNLHFLRELDLRHNQLADVDGSAFQQLSRLDTLYLNGNRLQSVPQFVLLPTLHVLSLTQNEISAIEPRAFSQLPELRNLYLSWNKLRLLQNDTFAGLPHLLSLSLNGNKIRQVELEAFGELPRLTSLHLQSNELKRLDSRVFHQLGKLEHIYFDDFTLCSAALHVRVCEPQGDGISSLRHLLDSAVLRAGVWVMAALACAGNTLVLLGRLVAREPNPVHSLYIKTLALADLTMGVYLLVIGATDWHYRYVYVKHDFEWRHSSICKACGFLSTLSCEASVLILMLITSDRLVSVTRPFDRRQPSLRRATLLVALLWLCAAVVAALPLCVETVDYFGEEFYGGNGVCLPLHLQKPFADGWEYSAAMFIALNTVALLFISCAYWRMHRAVRSSGLSLRSTQDRHDQALAHRFFIIVATDCLCWIPVIGVKLAALAGVRLDQQLCAWLAVLVLPINSALNPVLYTLTTSFFKSQVSRLLHAWKSRDTGQSPDSAASLSNMQLTVRRRNTGSQLPTRTSTLRSDGSYRSVQGSAV